MKRITALIFALILIVNCISITSFSADNKVLVEEERLAVLHALEIIDTAEIGEKELARECSRVQAAELFCELLGLEMEESDDLDVVFYDVSSDTVGYKYIKLIADAGYMIGYPDGRFRPTQTIMTEDAGRVLANMLGYKLYIEAAGINSVFQKTEIIDGVTLGKAATYGDMLNMIYNALHSPAYREVKFGNSITYEISEDYLGVEHLFNIKKSKGVLSGMQGTRLEEPNGTIKAGYVEIDNVLCKYADDASEFLGYTIDFYYKTKDGYHEIIYMEKNDKNKILVLKSEDLVNYSNFTYSYLNNNVERKVSISPQTDILYNGVAYPILSKEEMIPDYGDVTLIDNNGDNKYDVVLVKNVEFIVLDKVDAEKRTFIDKQTNNKYDFEKADELEIFSDGKSIAFDRLIPNSLLSIVRSKEDSGWYKVKVVRVNEALTNVVITGAGKDYINIAEKKYPVWDKISAESLKYLKPGVSLNLYMKDGVVVAAEPVVSDNYGYLIDVSEPEVFENSISFRLMLSDLKAVTADMGKAIKIDGTSYKDPAVIRSKLQASALLSAKPHATQIFAQPVKYKFDEKGILVALDTFFFDPNAEDAENSLRKLATDQYKHNLENKTLYLNSTIEFKAVTLEQSMKVPTGDRNAISDYQYRWLADNTAYWVDICNVDENSKQAEKVYVYIDVYANGVSAPYIVTRKWEEVDENGDIQLMLEYATSGSKVERVCVDYAVDNYDSLTVGDVIRVDTNKDNNVRAVTKILNVSEIPSIDQRVKKFKTVNNNTLKPPYADGDRLVYCTVLNYAAGNMLVTPSVVSDQGGIDTTYLTDNIAVGNIKIWEYSVNRGLAEVNSVTVDEIKSYRDDPVNPDTAVLDIQGSTLKQIFLIKNN